MRRIKPAADVCVLAHLWERMAGVAFAAGLAAACTPDIATDPQPAVMEFNPAATPPRAPEPTFALINPQTRLIDLGIAGIEVPADCSMATATSQAQCEFNQYLESLDGFPTTASARAPISTPVNVATATVPTNVAVIQVEGVTPKLVTEVTVASDPVTSYLQVLPTRPWPTGAFVWIGVRGYQNGIRTVDDRHVVASVAYNLLKRDFEKPGDNLLCGKAPAMVGLDCPYFALLARQLPAAAALASLVQLETLRVATNTLQGWTLLNGVGGIPKAEAAVLWGFPVHSAPVIELAPPAIAPVVAGNEIRLNVNGALDPASVNAFRLAQDEGSVYLLNLAGLGMGDLLTGFPTMTATYAAGVITIKPDAALTPGLYGVVVTRAAKSPTGKAMVPPPVSVLLMARGALTNAAGKSQVSQVSDLEANALEVGRKQLAALLDNPVLNNMGLSRDKIAYLYAFAVGAP